MIDIAKLKAFQGKFIRFLNYLYQTTLENFQFILKKSKDLSLTNYQLGLFHLEKGNLSDAILRFKLLSMFNPNYKDVLYQLARCYQYDMKIEKSLHYLTQATQDTKTIFRRNFLKKHNIENIPLKIIEEDYNYYANLYEEYTLALNYDSPIVLSKLFESYLNDNKILNEFNILDLGCGIGHIGLAFRDNLPIKQLDGIDISKIMAEKARQLEIVTNNESIFIYDNVYENDFLNFYKYKNNYDVIICGLSLHYHADLSQSLLKVKNYLKNDGYILLTLQKSSDQKINFDYKSCNFSYSSKYIEESLNKAGFEMKLIKEINIHNNLKGFGIIAKS